MVVVISLLAGAVAFASSYDGGQETIAPRFQSPEIDAGVGGGTGGAGGPNWVPPSTGGGGTGCCELNRG